MHELIKITQNSAGQEVVSAKELYSFLELDKSQWSRWSKQNIVENTFAIENEDWVGFDTMSNGNKTTDFYLTIDFAKRISMMAKTEKGEIIRKYFIQCEKIAKDLIEINPKVPTTFKEALLLAVEQQEFIEQQAERLALQAPLVQAFENVVDSANTYTLDSVSDILDIGRTTLAKMLEQKKWKTVKEVNGTSSTRFAEENGYAKTIFEYIKIGNKDVKTKRFVLRKKGLDKLIYTL